MRAYLWVLGLIIVCGCLSSIVINTPIKDICTGLKQKECNKNPECTCEFGASGSDGVRITDDISYTGCRMIGGKENEIKQNKLACMKSGGILAQTIQRRNGRCVYSNTTDLLMLEDYWNKTKYDLNPTIAPIPIEEGTPTQFTIKSLTYYTMGDNLVILKAVLSSKTGTPINLAQSTITMKIPLDTIVYTFGGRGKCEGNLSLPNTFYVNYLNSSQATNDVLEADNSVEVCWKNINGIKNITVTIIPKVGISTTKELLLGSKGDTQ